MSDLAARFEAALAPEARRIGEAIQAAGGRPLLVGGWVRDLLLGIPHSKDFDLEVFGLAPKTLRRCLTVFGPVHNVGRHFGVLKLATRHAEYDVSFPRREVKVGQGHKGFEVTPDPHMSFEEAASRRDFTINSMGYAFLERRLLDPFGGRTDLEAGCLRHVGPAFGEDPLRVLRAMQFAGRFAFRIAPETLDICRAQDLSELPRERMWDEFRKLLLQAPRPSEGFGYAEPLGVLPYFPELEALWRAPAPAGCERTPWAATMAVLDQAAALRAGDPVRDLVLMLAALCHRFGLDAAAGPEGPARRFLLRLTNEERVIAAVETLLRELEQPEALHARRSEGGDGAVRRLALRVALPFLRTAALARHRARAGPDAPFAAGDWLEERARALGVWEQPPEPLLKGRHLLGMGVRPGPAMGELLAEAFERQLDGELTTREAALDWVRRRLPASAAALGEGGPP